MGAGNMSDSSAMLLRPQATAWVDHESVKEWKESLQMRSRTDALVQVWGGAG